MHGLQQHTRLRPRIALLVKRQVQAILRTKKCTKEEDKIERNVIHQ